MNGLFPNVHIAPIILTSPRDEHGTIELSLQHNITKFIYPFDVEQRTRSGLWAPYSSFIKLSISSKANIELEQFRGESSMGTSKYQLMAFGEDLYKSNGLMGN